MTLSMQDASVYTNVGGLNSITQLGRENSPEALREVAKQFESMFINIMLKGMRAGEEALFSENYLRSNETKFHQESFDNQISLDIANAGGIGLADTLHRQLMQRYEPPAVDRQAFDGALNDVRRYPGSAVRNEPGVPASQVADNFVFESPDAFVEKLLPIAKSIAHELGIDPRVMVAQSALETGWGQKMIIGTDGKPSYNLFGIKAGDSWQGDSVSVSTLEFRDGAMQRERADFRAYGSFEESFRDYVDLLRSQPRYAPALQHAANADAFGQHLQDAGYATDPQYADKISRVLRSRALGVN
ncbi:flagellar assembly peptidoglycan hydrolase FlgJ [Pseudohongiella sp.]|uniref:Peptidoglycan hydrolase FlgJ n=1 Tax=marine sediment metagenome TaxID=412755 RepID=A0A0F9Z390_9ZZZZ|nr:flagellar assembly peptidoglycan hydrolase FlgJ [Pseudohongiella sp.]HDZ09148.1 flagellar assembly peptidoglycan hydrolase FlgJ [Pseudohongiella sp.]HEA63516.1 flagellar assembly peptidoglycan hydrolase FlgJ [Pseudohongiella sp.]